MEEDPVELFLQRQRAEAEATELQAARVARDEAIAQADAHALEEWKEQAYEAIEQIARKQPTVIANDLWSYVDRPREPRASGSVMQWAKKQGFIELTEKYCPVPSRMSHAAPVRVWRSLLWKESLGDGVSGYEG